MWSNLPVHGLEHLRAFCVVVREVNRFRYLRVGLVERLSRFARHDLNQFRTSCFEHFTRFVQDCRALDEARVQYKVIIVFIVVLVVSSALAVCFPALGLLLLLLLYLLTL